MKRSKVPGALEGPRCGRVFGECAADGGAQHRLEIGVDAVFLGVNGVADGVLDDGAEGFAQVVIGEIRQLADRRLCPAGGVGWARMANGAGGGHAVSRRQIGAWELARWRETAAAMGGWSCRAMAGSADSCREAAGLVAGSGERQGVPSLGSDDAGGRGPVMRLGSGVRVADISGGWRRGGWRWGRRTRRARGRRAAMRLKRSSMESRSTRAAFEAGDLGFGAFPERGDFLAESGWRAVGRGR